GDDRRVPAFPGRNPLHLPPGHPDPVALLPLRQADLPPLRGADPGRVALPGMRRGARVADLPHRPLDARQSGRGRVGGRGGGRGALGIRAGVGLFSRPRVGVWGRRGDGLGEQRQARPGSAAPGDGDGAAGAGDQPGGDGAAVGDLPCRRQPARRRLHPRGAAGVRRPGQRRGGVAAADHPGLAVCGAAADHRLDPVPV
ncbi:MAG: hypothetical protein AVDCRST_MAG73-1112, partial [uncultured Thermomicrobiales bacterium]